MSKPLKVISLGAGVQSTAMLLMSLKGEIERADCAIFADTGWEPQSVYDHLERLIEYCRSEDFPVYVVSAGNIRKEVVEFVDGKRRRAGQMPFFTDAGENGAPLMRQCTKEYKVEPIEKKVRELVGVKPRQRPKDVLVESWHGISLDEIQRMKDNPKKWIRNRYPLIEERMDRHNCHGWLRRNWSHPVPKSACIGCPYHSNAHWREMRDVTPDDFADAVDFDGKMREQPYPRARGKVYLHRSCKPLSEIDFDNAEDRGQVAFSFMDECEGMCGV